MIKAVFFDVDGTLVDHKGAQYYGCRGLYNYLGLPGKVDFQAFLSKWDELTVYHYDSYVRRECSYTEQRRRRIIDLFAAFQLPLASEKSLEIYDIYLRYFEDGWTLFPDVLPTLDMLGNRLLWVITNGDRQQQVLKLKKTGILPRFQGVTAGGDYDFPKPATGMFELVCSQNNLAYEECVYVGEDYRMDMLPCKKLGIRGVLINRKKKKITDTDIIILDSFEQLPQVIDNMD